MINLYKLWCNVYNSAVINLNIYIKRKYSAKVEKLLDLLETHYERKHIIA